MKEEILQAPEPHPVPPILTPSPPSAYPTVTTVWQDNDRYHPKPVLHTLSSEQPTDLNDNYGKSREYSGKHESSDPADKKLEHNLSFEIKKVPLQEGPRSFDGNPVLSRGNALKIKTCPSGAAEAASKPQERGSGDAPTETVQNPGIECDLQPVTPVAISSPEGHQGLTTTPDALGRPDSLPLHKEKGHAMWSLEEAKPERPLSEEASFPVLCHEVKHLHVDSGRPAQMDPPPSEPAVHRPSGPLPARAPLCFTNPLHSDDSDTDERNGEGYVAPSPSNVSVASATVSAATNTENVSARKVWPMSIAKQDNPVLRMHSESEKGKWR